MRSYGLQSGAAAALDVVGERWSLLIVRELLTGPRRYVELLEGLGGIATDTLANRLRVLEGAGVVRRDLRSRAGGYMLTDAGRALRPVVCSLDAWGDQFVGS